MTVPRIRGHRNKSMESLKEAADMAEGSLAPTPLQTLGFFWAPESAQTWEMPSYGKGNVGLQFTGWHGVPLWFPRSEERTTGLSRKIPNWLKIGSQLCHLPTVGLSKLPVKLISEEGNNASRIFIRRMTRNQGFESMLSAPCAGPVMS